MKQTASLLLGASLLAASAFAQLDLGGLFTQTVKAGQPWAAIDTKVENLSLNVQINRGVVTTVATLEYTPGPGRTTEYVCTPVVCDPKDPKCRPEVCQQRTVKELDLDSLETTAHFQEADNTILTDMYLWVGDVKVRAALQDRALASAQYEDIVKRRRDPALIETWGNGAYMLRIFPNESRKSRKIEIEFVQGMENEGSLSQTLLPVLHRLTKMAYDGIGDYASLPNRVIGNVSLTAVALDGKTYSLKWEGLGSGEIGAAPLRLTAAKVAELKPGVLSVSAAACAGCLTPWTAEKGGVSYFGVRTLLESKRVKFEAQPAERIFLLDVDGKDTLVAARARKVTLLSMKAYAAAPYTANLGLSDGKGNITYLFPKPVSMDAEHLRQAYEALRDWRPNADADAHATLRAHAKARGAGAAPSVAYLVNNDTTAYYHWTYQPNGMPKSDNQAQYEAWEKVQSAKEDETLAALQGAQAMLFGFWNDYRLNRIATVTGGFQIGTLHGYIYFPMRGGVVADVAAPDKPVDPLSGIHLPPLFGPGRPDAYSIADLKVTSTGLAIEHLVALQAQQYRYMLDMPMARDGGVVVDAVAKRSSDIVAPYYQGPDSVALRLSGQYKGSGSVTLTVTGLWGGLRFVQELRVDLPSTQASGAAGAGIWAYQQGEAWARGQVKYDLKAVQQLGKDYHIVNRQMSLLALEPGMDLWTEMPSRTATNGSEGGVAARDANSGAPASMIDSKVGFTGQNTAGALDKASLEDILNAAVGVIPPVISGRARGLGNFVLRRSGGSARLEWNLPDAGVEGARFRILDLSGRSVAELAARRTATGYAAEWRSPGRNGVYFVVAQAGGRTLVRKILWK